ncbi:MAG: hypothetical protein M3Q65_01930, partial [Chloroflexota bacterium]|nr:hypothetical protein [Chloroflexota bacterium]
PVVPGSAQIAAPRLVQEAPGGLTFKVTGTARTRAAVASDEERERLARQLAGKGDDEARAILADLPGVADYTVEYTPGWFPDRMPFRPSRIDIHVADER